MTGLGRFYTNKNAIEVGIDEAGRGPLIGRVYVGAVILDPEMEDLHPYLNDSKKITRKRREVVREWIEENASQFAVTYSDEKTIDKMNILKATHKAMHEAIDELGIIPDHIIVDGDKFPAYIDTEGEFVSHTCIVKGDSKYASICAASVLAKEYHDQYIRELVEQNPDLHEKYDLLNNMGYGTQNHINGIKKYGPSKFHRLSFNICR